MATPGPCSAARMAPRAAAASGVRRRARARVGARAATACGAQHPRLLAATHSPRRATGGGPQPLGIGYSPRRRRRSFGYNVEADDELPFDPHEVELARLGVDCGYERLGAGAIRERFQVGRLLGRGAHAIGVFEGIAKYNGEGTHGDTSLRAGDPVAHQGDRGGQGTCCASRW